MSGLVLHILLWEILLVFVYLHHWNVINLVGRNTDFLASLSHDWWLWKWNVLVKGKKMNSVWWVCWTAPSPEFSKVGVMVFVNMALSPVLCTCGMRGPPWSFCSCWFRSWFVWKIEDDTLGFVHFLLEPRPGYPLEFSCDFWGHTTEPPITAGLLTTQWCYWDWKKKI